MRQSAVPWRRRAVARPMLADDHRLRAPRWLPPVTQPRRSLGATRPRVGSMMWGMLVVSAPPGLRHARAAAEGLQARDPPQSATLFSLTDHPPRRWHTDARTDTEVHSISLTFCDRMRLSPPVSAGRKQGPQAPDRRSRCPPEVHRRRRADKPTASVGSRRRPATWGAAPACSRDGHRRAHSC